MDARIEEYIRQIDAKPRSIKEYKMNVERYLKWEQERGLTPSRETLLQYKQALGEQYKPSTANAYLAAAKSYYHFLEQIGECEHIGTVKGFTDTRDFKKLPLTAEQAIQLMRRPADRSEAALRDHAILTLMVHTGVRASEVIRANIENIRRNGANTVLYVWGKGREHADASVVLTSSVQTAIYDYLAVRGDVKGSDPLFTSVSNNNRNGSNRNGRLTTQAVSYMVKRKLAEIGISDDLITCHSLRHTAATLSLLSGASLMDTQHLLRHSKITTTQIYVHALEAGKAEEGIDRLLSEAESAAIQPAAVMIGE